MRGWFASILLASACGSAPIAPVPDSGPRVDAGPPHDYFVPDHVLEISIEMSNADWDAMRMQTRDFFSLLVGADCLDEPFASPFTFFDATLTIDGETRAHVAIR